MHSNTHKLHSFIIEVNNCRPESCRNYGKCTSIVTGFKCQCKPGFTGKQCETSKLVTFIQFHKQSLKYKKFRYSL